MNSTAVSEALQQAARPPGIDASQCLKDFADHLTRVQGLAPRTRQSYCFWVSRFLARFSATAAPDWSSLRGEDLTTFVQQEASRLHRYSRALPGTAIVSDWITALCRRLQISVDMSPGLKRRRTAC